MSTLLLEIVTPERTVYSEQVELIVARAATGDLGVLPGHTPLIASLVPGVLRVKLSESENTSFAVSGGFLEITPEKVTMLARSAEQAGEIDVDRAQEAKQRAEERLRVERDEKVDRARANAALQRAMARLQATKREH